MAEPRALPCHRRPTDAANPGGFRSPAAISEAWRQLAAKKLAEGVELATNANPDFVVVDEALHALAKLDPRKAQVVELRFFGGLPLDETAEALSISTDTVGRDWRPARHGWRVS